MSKYLNWLVKVSGFVALGVGIALLVGTFIVAYGFLKGLLGIQLSGDLITALGDALAPLVETSIRAIFLGIMGWTGSIISRRGVQILNNPLESSSTVDEDSKAFG